MDQVVLEPEPKNLDTRRRGPKFEFRLHSRVEGQPKVCLFVIESKQMQGCMQYGCKIKCGNTNWSTFLYRIGTVFLLCNPQHDFPFHAVTKHVSQAGPQPGFKVWGAKYISGGKIFVFIIYIYICSKQTFRGTKKFGGALPPNTLPWLRARSAHNSVVAVAYLQRGGRRGCLVTGIVERRSRSQ